MKNLVVVKNIKASKNYIVEYQKTIGSDRRTKFGENLEEKYDHASCILADLQGPKLRVGEFKNTEEPLKKGQQFILDINSELGDNKRVNFPHNEIYDHLTPTSTLLVNDGRIRLQVIEQNKDKLITEVLNDGIISNNKGVNIPDVILPIDSMTNKDRADLQKALEMLSLIHI